MKSAIRAMVLAPVFALNLQAAAQSIAEASSPSTNISVRSSSPSRVTPVVTNEYEIGVDDILAVNVWKEPELSRTLPVRPDGKITLPLLGDVQVAGKTPQTLQQELHDSLAAFVAVPEVVVIVQEVRSQKFNIVGQVSKPGSYPLSQPTTVLDAIAEAGGLGIYAKSNSIYVLRIRPDGSSVQLPFHYKQVLKGNNLSQNVKLQPRDTVVVP